MGRTMLRGNRAGDRAVRNTGNLMKWLGAPGSVLLAIALLSNGSFAQSAGQTAILAGPLAKLDIRDAQIEPGRGKSKGTLTIGMHFALDPALPQNQGIVDLTLAPRNGRGLVEFDADVYVLKPVDPTRGNGRLFFESGNRGTKRILPVFQNGATSAVK